MVGGFLFSMPVREEKVHVWLEPGQARAAAGESVLAWRTGPDAPTPARVVIEVEVGDVSIAFRQQPEPILIRSRVTALFPGAPSRIARPRAAGIFTAAPLPLFAEARNFDVSLREELAPGLEVTTREGQIVLTRPLPSRSLVVTGGFELSDPSGFLTRAAGGGFMRSVPGPDHARPRAQRVLVRP
jgi:hypothetical protein